MILNTSWRSWALPLAASIVFSGSLVSARAQGRDDEGHLTFDVSRPCPFEREYNQIRSDKTDPRVAFIETYSIVNKHDSPGDEDFHTVCWDLSIFKLSGGYYFDHAHAYLDLNDDAVSDETPGSDFTITYFSSPSGQPGVIVYSSDMPSDDDDSSKVFSTFILTYRNNKWEDVTEKYLGQFKLGATDYVLPPQYGHTARVLEWDRDRQVFRHKLWLTWDGKRFVPSEDAKPPADWRCPHDSIGFGECRVPGAPS
jgi:hypothetical protein